MDAVLDLGLRVDRLDGFRKAFEAVYAGNHDVFDTPVVEISQHAEPVMSTFLVRQVKPQ